MLTAAQQGRLEELVEAYRPFGLEAPFWGRHAPTIDLGMVRASPHYLDQKGYPHTEVLQAIHVRGLWWLVEKLGEDHFGVPVTEQLGRVLTSRDLLDSVLEISFLEFAMGAHRLRSARVLDIGAGYGRFAHRLAQAFADTVIHCTDAIPISTLACEEYLGARDLGPRVAVIPLHHIEDPAGWYDLAVNIHSWSECSLDAISFWLELLDAKRIERLFVVPHHPELRAWSDELGGGCGASYRELLEAHAWKQTAFWLGPACQPKAYHYFERTCR